MLILDVNNYKYSFVTLLKNLRDKSLAPMWHCEPYSTFDEFLNLTAYSKGKFPFVVRGNAFTVSGKTFCRYIAKHDWAEAKSFSTLLSVVATGIPATLALVQHTLGRRRRSATLRTKSRVRRTRHATAKQSHCESKLSCQRSSMMFSILYPTSSSVTPHSELCALPMFVVLLE